MSLNKRTCISKTSIRWTRSCYGRRCDIAARLPRWQCRAQAVSVSADGEFPSFSYRVTAKQAASTKLRLDSFLAAQIAADLAAAPAAVLDVSRAKVQASVAAGLVTVNGRPAAKASQLLKPGDSVKCVLLPPPPVQAVPEAIPLDIKFEDEHLVVINKPAGMVVHVAPGHYTGTLVNALLHHCALPAMDLDPNPDTSNPSPDGDDLDDGDDDLDGGGVAAPGGPSECGLAVAAVPGAPGMGFAAVTGGGGGGGGGGCLRPGIVHRLDKGTSGLLVVAKTEVALTRLQTQFKARTVDRLYESITVGCPQQRQGRVETNIVRDPRDRKRMAAAPYGSGRGRTAGSGYTVTAPLAGGGAALVRWKLDTGRTHQIRVHAKHLGHPLLGDTTYGGTTPSSLATVARSLPAHAVLRCVERLGRPALHARTLGFEHPISGRRLAFEQPPPEDFVRALQLLGWDPGAEPGPEAEAGLGEVGDVRG